MSIIGGLRPAGPGAGVLKYDVLTMMAVAGLAGPALRQTTMMRLIAIVTARYNWARDELTLGQREMARIWSVDERTAKREIRRLTESGLLVCIRPGVRGRVASYRLDTEALRRLGADDWDRVGPDFVERLSRQASPVMAQAGGQPVEEAQGRAEAGQSGWGSILGRLQQDAPHLAAAWLRQLRCDEAPAGIYRLRAPSAFHASYVRAHLLPSIEKVARQQAGPSARVEILAQA